MNLKNLSAMILLALTLSLTLSADMPPMPSCGPCDPGVAATGALHLQK